MTWIRVRWFLLAIAFAFASTVTIRGFYPELDPVSAIIGGLQLAFTVLIGGKAFNATHNK